MQTNILQVLDMNGRSHEDYQVSPPQGPHGTAAMSNGVSDVTKPDESVDSAISLPGSDDGRQQGEAQATQDVSAQPSVEVAPLAAQTSPSLQKSNANELPLYKPPAPLSQSPELIKRQPQLSNGDIPDATASTKRKRDSISSASGMKKARLNSVEPTGEDTQSLELAKTLQQGDLGLRQRSN